MDGSRFTVSLVSNKIAVLTRTLILFGLLKFIPLNFYFWIIINIEIFLNLSIFITEFLFGKRDIKCVFNFLYIVIEMLIIIIKFFELLFLKEIHIYLNLFVILIRTLEFSQISRKSKLLRKLSLEQFVSSSLSYWWEIKIYPITVNIRDAYYKTTFP